MTNSLFISLTTRTALLEEQSVIISLWSIEKDPTMIIYYEKTYLRIEDMINSIDNRLTCIVSKHFRATPQRKGISN